MKPETLSYKDKLLKAVAIQNRIVKHSPYMDQHKKNAMADQSNRLEGILATHCTLTQLKRLSNELLTWWNESVGIDTENFWTEMHRQDLDFERNDPLVFALDKGRFRRVDIGFTARKYWHQLKIMPQVTSRFSPLEIKSIDNIIAADEKSRLELLKKTLAKKIVPAGQYLKLGEAIAYFNYCRLFGTYFTTDEVKELYRIWYPEKYN